MEREPRPANTQPIQAWSDVGNLAELRIELERMVADLRLKAKGASAEAQHVFDALDEQVKRFVRDAVDAADETQEDLRNVGNELRMRIQKLANQIACSPSKARRASRLSQLTRIVSKGQITTHAS